MINDEKTKTFSNNNKYPAVTIFPPAITKFFL